MNKMEQLIPGILNAAGISEIVAKKSVFNKNNTNIKFDEIFKTIGKRESNFENKVEKTQLPKEKHMRYSDLKSVQSAAKDFARNDDVKLCEKVNDDKIDRSSEKDIDRNGKKVNVQKNNNSRKIAGLQNKTSNINEVELQDSENEDKTSLTKEVTEIKELTQDILSAIDAILNNLIENGKSQNVETSKPEELLKSISQNVQNLHIILLDKADIDQLKNILSNLQKLFAYEDKNIIFNGAGSTENSIGEKLQELLKKYDAVVKSSKNIAGKALSDDIEKLRNFVEKLQTLVQKLDEGVVQKEKSEFNVPAADDILKTGVNESKNNNERNLQKVVQFKENDSKLVNTESDMHNGESVNVDSKIQQGLQDGKNEEIIAEKPIVYAETEKDTKNIKIKDSAAKDEDLYVNVGKEKPEYFTIKNEITHKLSSASKGEKMDFEHVLDKMKSLVSQGKSEMIMELKPENLGKLALKIVTENGIVSAKFTAESQIVKEIIETNMQLLKDALQKQGLNIGEFSVSVGQEHAKQKEYSWQNDSKNSGNGETAKIKNNGLYSVNALYNDLNGDKVKNTSNYFGYGSSINLTA